MHPDVGSCPECGTSMTSTSVVIEYEARGGPRRYAKCPGCLEIVHPESTVAT